MAETTTRRSTRRDADHPDTTGTTPSMSTTDTPTEHRNGDTDGSKNEPPAGPQPAQSYAGSGVTDPIELSTETHGSHYRGPQGQI